jgi:hypothetical protein
MFATTLPENIRTKIFTNHDDYYNWLRDLNSQEGEGEWCTPHINNAEDTPMQFPCCVGVQVYPGIGAISIVFAFDISDATRMTYELVKHGAKLGDVIGTV